MTTLNIQRIFVPIISFLLYIVAAPLNAGTTGKIAGQITDVSTGEAIAGANIVITDTYLGAGSDLDGNYFIINIQPGNYTLEISSLNYQTHIVTDVAVHIDKTTTINAQLKSSVIRGETVTAQKPVVEVDRTFATSTVSTADLEIMPITRVQEAIDIQAGVVDGHFRGGRSGEVVYMIDDIPIQDVYDNTQGTVVNEGVVQELQVISGTFNAEYGQAMSGIINMVTKEGADHYSGQIVLQNGDFMSTHDDVFYNIGQINPLHIRNYELSLSGPLPITPKLSFFFNGRLEDSKGWQYGQRRWDLEHDVIVRSGSIVFYDPGFGDSKAVPMNPDRNIYLYGKLTYPITNFTKLNVSSLWEDRNYKDYDHDWKFVPDGDYKRFRSSRTNMLKVRTVLSQAAFFETGYANTFTEYHHYVYEDPYDSRYVHPVYSEKPSVTLNLGGNKLEHFRRFTDTHSAQSKLSWQITPIHYVVTGFNVSYNSILYNQFNIIHSADEYIASEDPTQPAPLVMNNSVEDPSGLNTDTYLYHPVEAAFYLQDKIEMNKFIVNVGLRFDYFDPDGKVLSDPQDPNIHNPLIESRRSQTLAEKKRYWYEDPTPKIQLSPRLGIAYPISEAGVLHFAYGHFFQRPKYEYLYTNPDFEIEPGQTINTLMGNADLESEKTISYEFGLQQGITDDIAMSVSIYQRDIQSLVSSDKIVTTYDAGTKYTQYVNRDFGAVRGVVLSLDRRYKNYLSAGVDYTYQIAEGNASEPGDAFNAAKGNKEPTKQLLPLDWDRRHTVNVNLNYVIVNDWGVSLLATYGSGLPYTSETRGEDSPIEVLFENDARKPDYFNVDINAFKMLNFIEDSRYTFKLELTVRNLFDRLNENDVFKDTGRATYTRDEELHRHEEIAFINTLDEVYTHPEFYSRPREVRIGLRMSF